MYLPGSMLYSGSYRGLLYSGGTASDSRPSELFRFRTYQTAAQDTEKKEGNHRLVEDIETNITFLRENRV